MKQYVITCYILKYITLYGYMNIAFVLRYFSLLCQIYPCYYVSTVKQVFFC